MAVVFPLMGAARGLLAIIRHSAFYKDPIRQALRSRAMCMVVRSTKWKPLPGETLHSLSLLPKSINLNKMGKFALQFVDSERKESYEYSMMGKPGITVRFDTLPSTNALTANRINASPEDPKEL